MKYKIVQGNSANIDTLLTKFRGKVQTCVTSPPYYGLRDYGVEGQIGLEQTPEEYVSELVRVFRGVRKLLRDDGTIWLNIGDSYAAQRGGTHMPAQTVAVGVDGKGDDRAFRGMCGETRGSAYRNASAIGLKHKDLIGIPWMLATALRDPYYTGDIAKESDRSWLASVFDTSISARVHVRDHGGLKLLMGVLSSDTGLLDACSRIFPHSGRVRGLSWKIENLASFLCEVYPYLRVRRKLAVLAYTFTQLNTAGKLDALSKLIRESQRGVDIDLPDWCVEPPSLFRPGFHLRQDIIWHKPNPMPESVKDRCTKAHEYMFLLSKSERYYFDADAIKEPAHSGPPGTVRKDQPRKMNSTPLYQPNRGGRTQEPMKQGAMGIPDDGMRNSRSVWTVNTRPYKGAHFAVFPPDLVRPCILAGSKLGSIVMDPFTGSGTTGYVSVSEGRNFVGVELNPNYIELAQKRMRTVLKRLW